MSEEQVSRAVLLPKGLLKEIEQVRRQLGNLKGDELIIRLLTVGLRELRKELVQEPLKNYREKTFTITSG